ncbi:hypothetical protein F4781DRAFT_397869 [Annulohypoxylon bovei var. microspora]|nr:hypothetical protein F4781DRAFT_397869 [Annulohypoxylon bovei var. microspora]
MIFPGRERPDSAYADFGLSEDLCSYREYSHGRAVAAVIEGLQTSSLAGTNIITQITWEEVRRVVANSLDLVFEEWRSNQPVNLMPCSEDSSPNNRRASTKSTQLDSRINPEGSGIVLRSQETTDELRLSCHPAANMDATMNQSRPDNESQQIEPVACLSSSAHPQNIDQDIPDVPGGSFCDIWYDNLADQTGGTTMFNSETSINYCINTDLFEVRETGIMGSVGGSFSHVIASLSSQFLMLGRER